MTPTPFEHIELKIMEAGFDRVDNSWNRFITFFPYYRIYYVVSGRAVIYLQDHLLTLNRGSCILSPPFPYSTRTATKFWGIIGYTSTSTLPRRATSPSTTPRARRKPRPSSAKFSATSCGTWPTTRRAAPRRRHRQRGVNQISPLLFPAGYDIRRTRGRALYPRAAVHRRQLQYPHFQRRPGQNHVPLPHLLFQPVHQAVRHHPAAVHPAKAHQFRSDYAL